MVTRSFAVFALFVLVFAGCSREPAFQVKGTVTHAGVPVPVGTLLFEPDPAKGNRGRGVMAQIKNGAYQTPPDGIVGGPHIVRIQGFDGKGDARGESLNGRPVFKETVVEFDFPMKDSTKDFDIPK